MATIHLTNGFTALVDDEDVDAVSQFNWHATKVKNRLGCYYCISVTKDASGRQRTIYMHRLVLGLKWGDGKLADHINANGLDNRRANLRVATRSQNNANRRTNKPYRGIYLVKNKWRAQVEISGRRIYLGSFSCPIEAAKAYDAAAVKCFGEFARLNFGGQA